MSRARIVVVAVVLVIFALVGGVLVYSGQHRGTGQHLVFDLTVTKASMSPSNISARLNDTITINIASDTSGEVHLHVYDIAFNTVAGQAVSQTFKADKTCGCDIEWESTTTSLGGLTVSP